MINSEDFSKRLEKVIDYFGETASSFSDKIGVQRSSISHILSGRNKPSLDFIMKILSAYPEVELYWLLNGKGSFPSKINSGLEAKSSNTKLSKSVIEVPKTVPEDIDSIVIFYKDGTFKTYTEQE